MPCSAKKFECNRPEMDASGFKDVDYGLTTREMAAMVKEAGIDLPKLPKTDFDDSVRDGNGLWRHLRRHRRRHGGGPRTVIELVCGIKVEKLFDHANIIPVRGFEGVRYVELPIKARGSRAAHPEATSSATGTGSRAPR